MWNHEKSDIDTHVVLCTLSERQGAALSRMLAAAGMECRLVPAGGGEEFSVLVEETDAELAELLLAKRKKDVEEEEEFDDEEEEEDDLEEDEDEDEDFDDEDIFYDDEDDE